MHHGSCQRGVKKINMVLNIHYLCLSVGWEVPKGDFNCDEIVLWFFFVILTAALAVIQQQLYLVIYVFRFT